MAVGATEGAPAEGGVAGMGSETGSHAMDVDVITPATIKNGVDVKESLLEDAGRGLFAQRKFARRGLITKYAGKKLEDKFAAAQCYPQTHIVHVSTAFNKKIGNDVYIDGDREPVEGSGGDEVAHVALGRAGGGARGRVLRREQPEHIHHTAVFHVRCPLAHI